MKNKKKYLVPTKKINVLGNDSNQRDANSTFQSSQGIHAMLNGKTSQRTQKKMEFTVEELEKRSSKKNK